MIDTIKLAYPLSPKLQALLERKAETLQKISPDGEILWEKSVVRGDCMESHYSGLRITMRKASDVKKAGFNLHISSLALFEFSLQKYQSESAYNNKNTSLETDIRALAGWVKELSSALNYPFYFCDFELFRVDLAENLILEGGSPREYIRSLELKMSKYHDAESKLVRFPGGVAYKSGWVGKKVYWKYKEFMDVEKKKHKPLYSDRYMAGEELRQHKEGLRALSCEDIQELFRMMRFESEFKRPFLSRHKLTRLFTLEKLRDRFEEEMEKLRSIKLLAHGDTRLSAMEEKVINLVKKFGFNGARHELLQIRTERTWYNIKSSLASKNIYLEYLDNSDQRLSEEEREKRTEEFKLKRAS